MDSLKFLTHTVQPIVLGVIFAIGTLVNGVLIFIFIFNKDMRTPPNFSVINLAIADFFSLAVNCLLINFKLLNNLPTGYQFCKTYHFCEVLGIGLSIYSVVLMCFQRFMAVTNTCHFDTSKCVLMEKLAPYIPIAVVWILSAFMASQALWFAEETHVPKSDLCPIGFPRKYASIVLISRFVFFCIVPLVIIAGTSIITSYKIRKSIKNMPGEADGLKKVIKARALSAKIVLALTVVFIVSYFPHYITALYTMLWAIPHSKLDERKIITLAYAISLTRSMMFLNACFNPIALYLMSRNYRTHMNKYFICGLASRVCKSKHPHNYIGP